MKEKQKKLYFYSLFNFKKFILTYLNTIYQTIPKPAPEGKRIFSIPFKFILGKKKHQGSAPEGKRKERRVELHQRIVSLFAIIGGACLCQISFYSNLHLVGHGGVTVSYGPTHPIQTR